MPSWLETLTALRAGDLEARDRVARLVIGVLASSGAYDQRDSWDDVVQEVFVTLLLESPRGEADGAVAAWIRRIAMNRYVDRQRKEAGRRRAGNPPTAGWRRNVPLEESRLPNAASLDESLQHDLAGALDALESRLRRIVECKYALGCTDVEGAERLGESLGTYKRLVGQALGELRRALVQDPKKP
jgi:RNA polymerase sigma factor (sigma-70 family)